MTKKRIEVINIYPNDKYNYLINESQRQFEIKAIKEVLFFKIDTDDAGDFGADFREVLYDSIIQEIYFEEYQIPSNYNFAVEVGFKPGVTDNLANTTVEALKLKNIETKVSTGRIFFIETNEPSQNLIKFAKETLGNDLIETIHVYDMLGLKNTNRFNKVFLPEVKLQEKFEVNEEDREFRATGSRGEKLIFSLQFEPSAKIFSYLAEITQNGRLKSSAYADFTVENRIYLKPR